MTHRRHYTQSSSFKMAALFTLLLGASAVLLGYYLADFSRQNLMRETEAAIDSEMAHVLADMHAQGVQDIGAYIAAKSAQPAQPIYAYLSAEGVMLAGQLDALPSQVQRMKEGVIRFDASIHGNKRLVAAKIHTFSDGARLLIARDIDAIVQSYTRLKWVSGLILFFMLVVVSVSFLISVFVVSRINRIAGAAQEMMETGDLSRRIVVDSRWDDLSHLARILNQLFARIEQLMEGIRDVSDSIAHDLRTPLTRLRNQLEAVQQTALSPQDAQRLLAEADQLLVTFQSLLRIANIEKAKRHQGFCEVDLQAILRDVIELYEPLAEDKAVQIQTDLQPSAARAGDRDLLFQLFANLMDNAVKFSPTGGVITVSLSGEVSQVIIADQGVGIAAEEHEKVFQRFYRADASRHRAGSGLGLSLVKATAELHQASVRFEDNHPGLRVIVTL